MRVLNSLSPGIKQTLYALGYNVMHTAISLHPHETLITTNTTKAQTRAAWVPANVSVFVLPVNVKLC